MVLQLKTKKELNIGVTVEWGYFAGGEFQGKILHAFSCSPLALGKATVNVIQLVLHIVGEATLI